MLLNHFIFCHPLLLLLSIFPSNKVFSSESTLHSRWLSIGNLAAVSVLPMNIQHCFPWGLTGLISLQSKGLSRVISNTTVQKHQFFSAQPSLWSKIKSLTVSPSICHEVMGPDAMILVFLMLNFKPAFSLSLTTFIKRLFSSSLLSPIRVVSFPYPGCLALGEWLHHHGYLGH